MELGYISLGAPEIIIIAIIILGLYLLFPIWGYMEGKKRTVGPIVGLLLGAVLGIIGIIIIYCTPRVDNQPFRNFQPPSNADELQKYKQLLDSGAITEDEYQTQKARILS
jgi:hypothetical protein